MKKEIKSILNLLTKPYMRILPGNLAFSFMVALIPILLIIVSFLNILNMAIPTISDKLSNIIPIAVLDIIVSFLNSNGWNSFLFLIIGLWTASSGMDALIIASNVVYDYENNSYLKRRLKALFLTLLLILIIIINLGILVFGSSVISFIIRLFNINNNILFFFNYLKWPIAIILIYFIVKIIYIMAPDRNIQNKIVNKGSLYTTILWMILSAIYSYYVSDIANYGLNYGSLANIIILLVWLYIISFVLVLGTAINVNEYNKTIK